jgi:hypothetical protein
MTIKWLLVTTTIHNKYLFILIPYHSKFHRIPCNLTLSSPFIFNRLYTEKELLTDLTAIVTLSRECEALLFAVDDHFRNVINSSFVYCT